MSESHIPNSVLSALPIVNISGYRFIKLSDAKNLQENFASFCLEIGLRGTVVFSPEGINVGVAGTAEVISAFINFLKLDARFSTMVFKESFSEETPYNKMRVKYRKMLVPSEEGIDPNELTGQRLDPKELKQWLDEGREFVLIDTRNDYEVEYGTFEKAIHLNIEHFRDFGPALQTLPEEVKNKPVVMFCTGGIRCEKATPIGIKAGLKNVYQLEGGVLDYFKDCQGAHWVGGCFVFDQRLALDPSLTAAI
jgi:predicted sulfurtransferase